MIIVFVLNLAKMWNFSRVRDNLRQIQTLFFDFRVFLLFLSSSEYKNNFSIQNKYRWVFRFFY
ncbi:MAG: hypothetical protein COB93_05850 [Sneathiella sp.]|nr:MAG: hypothetical protein COB93_05850 [Sneathiella sp.]